LDVKGELIRLSPYIVTFIHRPAENENLEHVTEGWVVTELTSGASVATGRTKKEAVEESKKKLRNVTLEQLLVVIRKTHGRFFEV